VTVSWSLENVGTNLPTLLSTVCGNLYELRELSGLRLLDVELPPPSRTPIPARGSASKAPGTSSGSTKVPSSGRS
jgi:ribulose-bisphosphate carboxylase large chain